MTDASDPLAGGEPAPPPSPAADQPPPAAPAETAPQVLAKGHLHPAILLLHLFDAMRQAAVPIVFGIVLRLWWLAGLGLVAFLVRLAYPLVRYLTLEYTLTTDELRVREGLLHRQERRIPLDRIQDLGFESTILRRALGLAVVLVDTASGTGVEARLDALSRADAEHLRDVLLAARKLPRAGAAPAERAEPAPAAVLPPPVPDPEWLVHRSSPGELVLRGVTDLRFSAIALTGLTALQFADQLGMTARVAGAMEGAQSWIAKFPPLVIALILAGTVLGVIALGVVTTTLGNLVTFHGFQLVLRGDVLQRRFGLLTTRQKTLPRARIQRVTVEQPWLRRMTGVAVVKADSAGGSRSDGADVAGGWDVVVPLSRLDGATAILPALLPGLEREAFEWRRGSSRLIGRTTLQGVVMAALSIAALWWPVGPRALFALLLVPLWALIGVLVWRNLGFALGSEFLTLQHGIVGRTLAYVPTAKVQAVVMRQGPFAQLLGLAELTVYVAGGSPTRLPDLTLGDARVLTADIAARAAAAAARTW